MKRLIAGLIAATSFAALAHSALADESYGPPEVNNTERSLPEFAQPEQIEDTGSAAAGDSTPSDGESAGAEVDAESTSSAEIDQ